MGKELIDQFTSYLDLETKADLLLIKVTIFIYTFLMQFCFLFLCLHNQNVFVHADERDKCKKYHGYAFI